MSPLNTSCCSCILILFIYLLISLSAILKAYTIKTLFKAIHSTVLIDFLAIKLNSKDPITFNY